MDVDPQAGLEEKEKFEKLELESDRAKLKLNALVAITIAIIATFMGLCKIKDENLVLEMQRIQASRLDAWNHYQARNIREDIYTSTSKLLSKPDEAKKYQAMAAKEHDKKDDESKNAKGFEKEYDEMRDRHDLFDLEDAALAIAISLFAITALTEKRWLFVVASIPATLGIFFGTCGFFNIKVHADVFLRLLGN